MKTHYIELFIYYALNTHFIKLKPLILRMLESIDENVERVAARQICVASLNTEIAKQLALNCINGSENQQIGAAEIFAVNIKDSKYSDVCKEALKKFFYSPNKDVQEKAGDCFRHIDYDDIGSYCDIIEYFIESPAFLAGADHLIFALVNSNCKIPEISIDVCKKFFDLTGIQSSNISNSAAGVSYEISRILARLYNQNVSEDIKSMCLNLMDHMIQLRALGLSEVLYEYER